MTFLYGIKIGISYLDAGSGKYGGLPVDADEDAEDDVNDDFDEVGDDGMAPPPASSNLDTPAESAPAGAPAGAPAPQRPGVGQGLKNRAADALLSKADTKLNGATEQKAVSSSPGQKQGASPASPSTAPSSPSKPPATVQAPPKPRSTSSGGGLARDFARRGVSAAQDYRKNGGNASLGAAGSIAGGVAKDMAKEKAKQVGTQLAQKAAGKVANKAAGQATGVDIERTVKAGKSAADAAKSAASGDLGAVASNAAKAGVQAADVGLLFSFRQLYLNVEGGPFYPFQLIGAWILGNVLIMFDLIGLIGIGDGSGMSILEKLAIFAVDLLLFIITLGITVLIVAYGLCGGVSGWVVWLGSWVSTTADQVNSLCKALGK